LSADDGGPVAGQRVDKKTYTSASADVIERKWQHHWRQARVFEAANPVGGLQGATPPEHSYILDMFPYPSGTGLHVGHPLGFIATDVLARYLRTRGENVLYTMGFDAFGLPAEQYAVQTGTHPATTTAKNVSRYRAQLERLGMSYDERRMLTTTDPKYYRWTQWIFTRLYDSYYDPEAGRARPISALVEHLESGQLTMDGKPWRQANAVEQAAFLNGRRLAYVDEAPVNWCPGLGTVLADEEVTADRRSERGNYPVFRTNLRQWKLRITAYADRLLDDLAPLDWPESIKLQQRNWIGKSRGVNIRFTGQESGRLIEVFTTRPDTLFGASYIAVSPESELADDLLQPEWPESTPTQWRAGYDSPKAAAGALRAMTPGDPDQAGTGVFTGSYAIHPVTQEPIPIFLADYVLAGYGAGAVMGVPAHDARDHRFATAYGLPIRPVIVDDSAADTDTAVTAYTGTAGHVVNSAFGDLDINGMSPAEAKDAVIDWLQRNDAGDAVTMFKLRDWLFSRQRYWGEPIPVVYDEDGVPHRIPDSMLPVELPDLDNYSPRTFDPDDADTTPETPLSRDEAWVNVVLDLGDGPKTYRRDTNTMPNWAGSSWYELRYIDPTDDNQFVDKENEAYWMGPTEQKPLGGTDLYIGGTEHAVLHLLYARFWHKVLHDLGYLTSSEPFHRLFNQGMIQAYVYRDSRGLVVPALEVTETREGTFLFRGEEVTRQLGKMGKSLKNSIAPDDIVAEYGADTFRVYAMSTGPLSASRPWITRAVVGAQRFLQRVWRCVIDQETGEVLVTETAPPEAILRALHETLQQYHIDVAALRFNSVIARLIEYTNTLTKNGVYSRAAVEPLILMLAPFAPHLAEELWERLGHRGGMTRLEVPQADPALAQPNSVTAIVQINGKVRARIEVSESIVAEDLERTAVEHPVIAELIAKSTVRKAIVKPPTVVNFVVS
jgi:leucyl-tRNA synthetase